MHRVCVSVPVSMYIIRSDLYIFPLFVFRFLRLPCVRACACVCVCVDYSATFTVLGKMRIAVLTPVFKLKSKLIF